MPRIRAARQDQSTAILSALVADNRYVLSAWRATLLLRRATALIGPNERRWRLAPNRPQELFPLLRNMEASGYLSPVRGIEHVYYLAGSFAPRYPIDSSEILMEANPYSALCLISALSFHQLNDTLPRVITAFAPKTLAAAPTPIGTAADDWIEGWRPHNSRPISISGQPVRWSTPSRLGYQGVAEYRPHGVPVRVTDLERSLIDAIQNPVDAGGILGVLKAWVNGIALIDIERLIGYVDAEGTQLLKQRVGYLLESLGVRNPAAERWRAKATRGGSAKLVADAPFVSAHSETWNLSLNAPVDLLQQGDE
jgi:hypothetical protein